MSDKPNTKPMGMLLQDPFSKDDKGKYLHDYYRFPLDKNFLAGMGSSKFIVRDPPERGSLDWNDSAIGLTYEDFEQRAGDSSSVIDDPQFRQVNAFAVASHTLHAVEEALGREITWKNNRPLEIRAHAELADGHYDSFSSSLYLGFAESQSNHTEGAWISLSHDIISHEVGHAIFDSFRPLFVYSEEIDTDALHESFADLVALFSKLEHPTLVKQLYEDSLREGGEEAVSSSNFHKKFLFGGWQNPFVRQHLHPGLLTGLYYDPQEPAEPHERSSIWTAAIFDILNKLQRVLMAAGTETRKGNSHDFTQAVVSAADQTRLALLRALQYAPLSGVTMPLLARLFCEADERLSPEDYNLRKIAEEVFKKRNLWDSKIQLDPAPEDIGQAWIDDFEKADTALRTRMVVKQAEALRIPLAERPRILTPRLIRANNEIYLYFAYELVDPIKAPIYEPPPGTTPEPVCLTRTEQEERVRVPSYYGGTLVIDEKFEKPGVLVTDPPEARTDTQEAAPAPEPERSPESRRREVIKSDLGYLLRHMEGYYKTPGFAGFDWPENG